MKVQTKNQHSDAMLDNRKDNRASQLCAWTESSEKFLSFFPWDPGPMNATLIWFASKTY